MKYKLTVAQAKELIETKISHYYGVTPEDATNEHFYKSIVLIVSDLMKEAYKEFHKKAKNQNKKTVYYLCMEFLMGRSLKNNLFNLGLESTMASALSTAAWADLPLASLTVLRHSATPPWDILSDMNTVFSARNLLTDGKQSCLTFGCRAARCGCSRLPKRHLTYNSTAIWKNHGIIISTR